MTISTVARNALSGGSTSSTSHSITLPTGGSAGDLYLVICSPGQAATCSSTDSGWTKLGQSTATPNLAIFAGIVGTASSSLTIATSASVQFAYAGFVVTGWDGNVSDISFATANASSSSEDPPSLTATVAGSGTYLWIAVGSSDNGASAYNPNAAPTNYTNFQNVQSFTSGSSGEACISTAERILAASSENPGAFTGQTFTQNWASATIAIPEKQPGVSTPVSDSGGVSDSASVLVADLKSASDSGSVAESAIVSQQYTTTLTGAGNWTAPSGITSVTAECIGGGGSTANVSGAGVFSNSAAGGSYAKKTFTTINPGDSVAYSVGAGAVPAGTGFGQDGGASWFGSNDSSGCVAVGGMGGAKTSGNSPGTGTTTGCYGDVLYRGGNGATGTGGSFAASPGGGGGAGRTGNGGDAAAGGTAAGAGNSPGGNGGAGITGGATGHNNGSSYGGGGGGAIAGSSSTVAGANGGVGTIVLTYTIVTNLSVNEPVSDSAAGSEAAKLSLTGNVEAVTASDTAQVLANSPVSESATVAESAKVIMGAADSATTTDSARLALAGSDSVTAAESVPGVTMSASDTVSGTESIALESLFAVLDAISAAELAKMLLGTADSASLADSAASIAATLQPVSDSISATESAGVGVSIAASDGFSAAESALMAPQGADSGSASDLSTTSTNKTAADTISASELAQTLSNKAAADGVSFAELASVASKYIGTDACTVTESARVLLFAGEAVTAFDHAGVRDSRGVKGERVYRVPAENRTYTPPSEQRNYKVQPERRAYSVPDEHRKHIVPDDKRTYGGSDGW